MNGPILYAEALTQQYPIRRGPFRAPAILKAVDGVGFSLREGETLAVVGESGSGKSTLGRMLTLIERPTGGCAPGGRRPCRR